MTSITNKSKESATINKTVKDGTVTIEVVGSKKQTVRPIMTVEARDAINDAHERLGCESRSESIVSILKGRDHACECLVAMDSSLVSKGVEVSKLSRVLSKTSGELDANIKEAQRWKLIAWSMTAACAALIATMMITAS